MTFLSKTSPKMQDDATGLPCDCAVSDHRYGIAAFCSQKLYLNVLGRCNYSERWKAEEPGF